MSDYRQDHPQSDEVVFDITKPVDGVTFLGLLDGFGRSANRLTALFDWQCRACGAINRDAAIVEPEQGLLCRWSCSSCAEATVLRFRARASTEWIAEHTLAVTGGALCHLAEDDVAADLARSTDNRKTVGGQRTFAWIAIPGLVILILLGLSDVRRFADLSAAPAPNRRATHGSPALSRLLGSWLSDDGRDRLYFNHVNSVSRTGTYTRFFEEHGVARHMRFTVIYEDPKREQFVFRQRTERSDVPEEGDAIADGWDTALHIRLHGESLTWIDIDGDNPIVKVYRRAKNP